MNLSRRAEPTRHQDITHSRSIMDLKLNYYPTQTDFLSNPPSTPGTPFIRTAPTSFKTMTSDSTLSSPVPSPPYYLMTHSLSSLNTRNNTSIQRRDTRLYTFLAGTNPGTNTGTITNTPLSTDSHPSWFTYDGDSPSPAPSLSCLSMTQPLSSPGSGSGSGSGSGTGTITNTPLSTDSHPSWFTCDGDSPSPAPSPSYPSMTQPLTSPDSGSGYGTGSRTGTNTPLSDHSNSTWFTLDWGSPSQESTPPILRAPLKRRPPTPYLRRSRRPQHAYYSPFKTKRKDFFKPTEFHL